MKRLMLCVGVVALLSGCQDWQSTAPFAKPLVAIDGPTHAQRVTDQLADTTRACREHAPADHCRQSTF